ncbi:hypothetical protein [Paraburkholderia sp. GAS32]|uniref:hypothetical protein n=1 Tax=Paraburkholderia sp. GAS32 TaxID=3035129 RepID=UPI003D1CD974
MKKLIFMLALANVATGAMAMDVGGVSDGGAYDAEVARIVASAPVNHPVTVITLSSTTLPGTGLAATTRPVVAQPIRVVDGGVKTPDGTCFDLDAQGNVKPLSGNCVVLRSVDSH